MVCSDFSLNKVRSDFPLNIYVIVINSVMICVLGNLLKAQFHVKII